MIWEGIVLNKLLEVDRGCFKVPEFLTQSSKFLCSEESVNRAQIESSSVNIVTGGASFLKRATVSFQILVCALEPSCDSTKDDGLNSAQIPD
jgi:hypothetical protein